MNKKISLLIYIILSMLLLIGCKSKEVKALDILDLVQKNYISIQINDKKIEKGSNQQYLIDDFIPKLSRYTLQSYEEELPETYSYKVDITYKDNSKITLLDNVYLAVNDVKYKILDGTIYLNKFYDFIE